MIQGDEPRQRYETRWSLTDEAKWKYDVREVYKANQTKAFHQVQTPGKTSLFCVENYKWLNTKDLSRKKNENKDHSWQNGNSPLTHWPCGAMTWDQSAYIRVSQVTGWNYCISWWWIGKLEKEIIIRKTAWGPVQKGKHNNEVHRSPVHSICKASPMVQWINRANEGKQGEQAVMKAHRCHAGGCTGTLCGWGIHHCLTHLLPITILWLVPLLNMDIATKPPQNTPHWATLSL